MRTAVQPQLPPVAQGIFLGRQPILDRDQDLVAFELLFRSGAEQAATFTDGTVASATVIDHALSAFGLDTVLGPYRGFVNLDAALLLSDLIELLPKERVVLEILETVRLDANVIERIAQLQRRGFTLALDDVTSLPTELEGTLAHIDIVKIDVQQVGLTALTPLVERLRAWPCKLLAEKVDDRAQADACLALGFDLFQGYFYAKPQLIEGKRLSPAEMTVMRLLGLVVADAESSEIEHLLKQEPLLTMNLLRLANSIGAGGRGRVASVASAVMLLGRRQLLRWIQLLLYACNAPTATLPTALMHLAATRGRMMELLAQAWADKSLADRAFMIGIMSLMDTLLSLPLAELLAPLPLDEDVRLALLERKGRLGALLDLVEAVEGFDLAAIERSLALLKPLTHDQLQVAHTGALAWSNSIGSA